MDKFFLKPFNEKVKGVKSLLPLLITFLLPCTLFCQNHPVQHYIDENSTQSTHVVVNASATVIEKLRQSGDKFFFRQIATDYFVIPREKIAASNNILIVGNANINWKLPPGWSGEKSTDFSVATSNLNSFKEFLKSTSALVLSEDKRSSTAIIRVTSKELLKRIIENEFLTFIRPVTRPHEETLKSYLDLSVNNISSVHAQFPQLHGDGYTFSVKELSIDKSDIDFRNRIFKTPLEDPQVSSHANEIATIIGGGGNTAPSTKGVAWKSTASSSSFKNLLPDDPQLLSELGVDVQNHSYGIDVENFYGPEARAYDLNAESYRNFIHVFSSGNAGLQDVSVGPYAGIYGYANVTGNMKAAKNVLVVGGHYEDFSIDPRNSAGPTYDGRIKPEIVAYGPEGTSDAAAFVSGTILLMQQACDSLTGSLPPLDLLKSVLVATADDAGKDGIDHKTGYGSMNSLKAVKAIVNKQYHTGTLSDAASASFDLNVPAGIKKLSVALNWIDPAAEAGDMSALVNDLDLAVSSGSTKWLPWTLSHYPHADSLSRAAVRSRDHVNNTELVTVDFPSEGIYRVIVSNENLRTSPQTFHVAYWMDSMRVFNWTFPQSGTDVEADSSLIFRWDTTFDGTGSLEVSLGADDFIPVAGINLSDRFYKWIVPDFAGTALARVKIGDKIFRTDTFSISPALVVDVGFSCQQEFLLQWKKIPGASAYNLYQLGATYMEKVLNVTDTFVVLSRTPTSLVYYAIAPVFNDYEGLRSLTYNVDLQGVKCYYKNFLASANAEGFGSLVLHFGSIYRVKKITWQKNVNGSFVSIGTTEPGSALSYFFVDQQLKPGVTIYRAVIEIDGGEEVTTDPAVVYYADERSVFVYPNPVSLAERVEVLSDGEDLTFSLHDVTGKLVLIKKVFGEVFRFTLEDLHPGLYLYNVTRQSAKVSSGRLIIKE
jgi:hypothetical protein